MLALQLSVMLVYCTHFVHRQNFVHMVHWCQYFSYLGIIYSRIDDKILTTYCINVLILLYENFKTIEYVIHGYNFQILAIVII